MASPWIEFIDANEEDEDDDNEDDNNGAGDDNEDDISVSYFSLKFKPVPGDIVDGYSL